MFFWLNKKIAVNSKEIVEVFVKEKDTNSSIIAFSMGRTNDVAHATNAYPTEVVQEVFSRIIADLNHEQSGINVEDLLESYNQVYSDYPTGAVLELVENRTTNSFPNIITIEKVNYYNRSGICNNDFEIKKQSSELYSHKNYGNVYYKLVNNEKGQNK